MEQKRYVLVFSDSHNIVLQIGWVKPQNLFLYNSGVWKSENTVLGGLVSSDASLLDW